MCAGTVSYPEKASNPENKVNRFCRGAEFPAKNNEALLTEVPMKMRLFLSELNVNPARDA
jgi:hypothetical protein